MSSPGTFDAEAHRYLNELFYTSWFDGLPEEAGTWAEGAAQKEFEMTEKTTSSDSTDLSPAANTPPNGVKA